MIKNEVYNIFEFIDFLDQNKQLYIEKHLPICHELRSIRNKMNALKPNDNYQEKLEYDLLKKQATPKFDIVYSEVYLPIMGKLSELNIWTGDKVLTSIPNNISSATTTLKSTFNEDEVPLIQSYKEKYLSFRKETNSNFLTLEQVFSYLDEALGELFEFFSTSDENDFEFLKPETIVCENIGEAISYYAKNKNRNIRFSIPNLMEPPRQNHSREENDNSYREALYRINLLKHHIEDTDIDKLFEDPINQKESILQKLFALICTNSTYDINAEVNNGRGPVDFKISKGSHDTTLVEFKLAKSSKLKSNLQYQVEIYKKANNTKKSITVILYFTTSEYNRATNILKELNLDNNKNIILIDGRVKLSASNVR